MIHGQVGVAPLRSAAALTEQDSNDGHCGGKEFLHGFLSSQVFGCESGHTEVAALNACVVKRYTGFDRSPSTC
jgi:hypothetical protein